MIAISGLGWISPLQLPLIQVNTVQDFVTMCGFVLGLATAYWGVATYIGTVKSARLTHMHGLFGEYLKMRLELTRAAEMGGDASKSGNRHNDFLSEILPPRTLDNLLSIKLYTLEEMWLWLKNEYPRSHGKKVRALKDASLEPKKLNGSYLGWLTETTSLNQHIPEF